MQSAAGTSMRRPGQVGRLAKIKWSSDHTFKHDELKSVMSWRDGLAEDRELVVVGNWTTIDYKDRNLIQVLIYSGTYSVIESTKLDENCS